MKIKLWYNKDCSKSNEVLSILEENNIEYELINYLEDEITKENLLNLILKLKNSSSELIRFKESGISTQGKINKLSVQEIIDLILSKPEILQRPIIQTEDFSFIARPTNIISKYLNLKEN